MSRMSIEGVVGFVMWDCDVVSVYGYVHSQSNVRKCSRIHRLPLQRWRLKDPLIKGRGPRYTSPPRRGWHLLHWRGVIKNYARAVEDETSFSKIGQGVLGGVIICAVCVCLIRP